MLFYEAQTSVSSYKLPRQVLVKPETAFYCLSWMCLQSPHKKVWFVRQRLTEIDWSVTNVLMCLDKTT